MVQNLRAYFSYFMLSQSNVQSVCRKRLNFLACTKTKVDLNQNFRRSLLAYNDKKIAGKFSGVAKEWHPLAHGW